MSNNRPGAIPFKELYVYYYGSQFVKYVGGLDNVTRFYTDHTANLMENISKNYQMSRDDLKKLENDYNELIQARINMIKELTGTNEKKYKIKGSTENDVMRLMISKLLAPKNGVADYTLDAIIAHLEWDQKKGSYQYKGGALFLKDEQQAAEVQKKLNMALGKAEHWRETKSIQTRLNAIKEALPKDLESSVLGAYKARIAAAEVWLNKAIAAETGLKHTGGRLHATTIADAATGETSLEIANAIYQEMKAIETELSGLASINNRLAAYFSELVGHLVAQKAPSYIATTLKQEFENWAQNGLGTTGANKDDSQLQLVPEKMEWLDQKVLESRYSNSNSKGNIIKDEYGVYSLREVNSDINNGKTDAVFTLETKFGEKRQLNISLKTTSLLKSMLPDDKFDKIELQSSTTSLLTYLLGAPSENNKFARYTLNLMTEHPKENNEEYQFDPDDLNGARTAMLKSVKLQMLYSALSGAHQGRSGQQANILAIYDKGKQGKDFRVKFFTYDAILNEAAQDLTQVRLSAELTDRFDNKFKEPKYGTWAENEPLARARVTNIIVDARDKQFSVAIAKQALRNLQNLK